MLALDFGGESPGGQRRDDPGQSGTERPPGMARDIFDPGLVDASLRKRRGEPPALLPPSVDGALELSFPLGELEATPGPVFRRTSKRTSLQSDEPLCTLAFDPAGDELMDGVGQHVEGLGELVRAAAGGRSGVVELVREAGCEGSERGELLPLTQLRLHVSVDGRDSGQGLT